MDAVIVMLAEQGYWFIAFLIVLAVLWHERRARETNGRFRQMLEAHDAKNETDFARIDGKFDDVRKDMHDGFADLRERLAKLEGALLRKDGGDGA